MHRTGDVEADEPELGGQIVLAGEVAADADAGVDDDRFRRAGLQS